MRLETREYPYDMQQTGELPGGKMFADYAGNTMLRPAVGRQFWVIGEGKTNLARIDEAPCYTEESEEETEIESEVTVC